MTIRNTVACVLLFFAITAANSQKIDSLKALLNSTNGADRIDLLFQLSSEHIRSSNRQAMSFALYGYALSLKCKDSLQMVRTVHMVSVALTRLQDLDSSLIIYCSVITIAKRNNYRSELSIALNSALHDDKIDSSTSELVNNLIPVVQNESMVSL